MPFGWVLKEVAMAVILEGRNSRQEEAVYD
jgi:hypothetical protein